MIYPQLQCMYILYVQQFLKTNSYLKIGRNNLTVTVSSGIPWILDFVGSSVSGYSTCCLLLCFLLGTVINNKLCVARRLHRTRGSHKYLLLDMKTITKALICRGFGRSCLVQLNPSHCDHRLFLDFSTFQLILIANNT